MRNAIEIGISSRRANPISRVIRPGLLTEKKNESSTTKNNRPKSTVLRKMFKAEPPA
jgi:hypothetical protein